MVTLSPTSEAAQWSEHLNSHESAPPVGRVEQAYERIRDDIVFLRADPGQQLSDKELCRTLGVSLGTVRNAIKRLTLERLVVTYPRHGTFVTQIALRDELWLSEIRISLEGLAAALAAERASPAERETLQHLLARPDDEPSNQPTGSQYPVGYRIHQLIYTATHNPYVQSSLPPYLKLAMRIWHFCASRVPARHLPGDDQHAVVSAIVRGDFEAAASAACAHVRANSDTVRSILDR